MLLLWKFKTKTATETENLALEVKSDTVDGKKKRTGLVGQVAEMFTCPTGKLLALGSLYCHTWHYYILVLFRNL